MTTKCTDNLTLGEIKELMQIFGKTPDAHQPFEVGKAYLIRTVTFYYTGRVKSVGDKEIVLSDVAWIADTDRFNNALRSGNFKEIEPFLHDVIIGRGAIIDATIWDKDLPRSQK